MRIPAIVLAAFLVVCNSSCSKDSTPTPSEPPATDSPVVTPPPVIETQKAITGIDNAVKAFMTTYHVPGISIAVTKDEKLVYVKSYGQMDNNDTTPVTNTSLFRIASLSKQFTSVAIMKLIEAKKLTMASTVFGKEGILTADYPAADPFYDITIDQLLHHTTGNWPNDGSDPMFQQPSMSTGDLIKWTLANYPDKGKRGQYYYSNFGYCLLGRVIEKVSGKTYAQFIQDEILTPSGITDMVIGGNTMADRKPQEVKYFGQDENPYDMNIARMDSHGGWLATASDLMRFLVKVDGFTVKPDILQSATETLMTTPSAGNSTYACGWAVNKEGNWWHTGSLPGTVTEQVRTGKGFNWAILCNTRVWTTDQIFTDLDQLLWPAVNDASTPWETRDQF